MSIDPYDRVAALAPELPADPDGLARALAAFERGRNAHTAAHPTTTRRPTLPSPRRHVRRLALAGAAALAVAAGAIVLPGQLHRAPSDGASSQYGPLVTGLLPAAAADNPECASPEIDQVEPSSMPREAWSTTPIASIMALVGETTPDTVTAYEAIRRCPTAVAVAVVYDTTGTRGVNVYRDVARDEYTAVEDLGSATEVSVRGVTGYALAWVNDDERPRQRLTWFDATGARWYAEADGMPVEETLAVLDALTFDAGGTLESTSVPPGYHHAPAADPAAGAEPTYTWVAEYGVGSWTNVEVDGGTYDKPGAEWAQLVVTAPAVEPIEARIAEYRDALVDLDGLKATWTDQGQGQGAAQLTWVENGARYRLTAVVDSLAQMLEVARTVHSVTPNDPLLD